MHEDLYELMKLHAAALEILAKLIDDDKLLDLTSEIKIRIIKLAEKANLKNVPPLHNFIKH